MLKSISVIRTLFLSFLCWEGGEMGVSKWDCAVQVFAVQLLRSTTGVL